jgi:cell filamentation protein
MTATIDGLPARLRHAVRQTVASQRLEGWEPTEENISALVALAGGDISFAEYLATFRARHPPPVRRRRQAMFGRRTPYFVPGTTVLRNNFGADSAKMLAELECVATAGRMVQWFREPAIRAAFDVRDAHRHVFSDVYPWAGEYRTTELRRGDSGFAWQSSIAEGMARLSQRVADVVAASGAYDNPRLSYELARVYADYNQIHPFREGNGRAGALLLHDIAARCGRRLDLTSIRRDDWYAAARDSMPLRRDGRASHRPFLFLLLRAVVVD